MTDKQKAISELQQWLRNIMKNASDDPAIIPDGIFSSETRFEVESFQRERGLPVTGIVDLATWEALREASLMVDFNREAPRQVAPISNEDLPLIRGMNNKFTDTLKLMLNHVAENYRSFEFVEEQGFAEATQRNVRRWQSVAFLAETGEVDKATWNTLSDFYLMQI